MLCPQLVEDAVADMKIIPIQTAYQRKFERQRQIAGLEYHAAGHCVHIGRLSPGCLSCFIPDPSRANILAGTRCNLHCVYCVNRVEEEPDRLDRIRTKAAFLKEACLPQYSPRSISFSGGGEPLLYVDVIAGYMDVLNDIFAKKSNRPWFHVYTNGLFATTDTLLRLKDLGIDEMRFHLGASNFSKKVYRNLKRASALFKTVSVETPAWPPHRKNLFEMLPLLDDHGVRHLNLGEIEITPYNYGQIAKVLPDAEIYPCYEMHLYDGGLTYDLMEEVVRRKYRFSILDCSCFVKSIQRGQAKFSCHERVEGLVARPPEPATEERLQAGSG